MVAVHSVPARATVPARRRRTLVDVYAAVFAGESGPTPAFVVVVEN